MTAPVGREPIFAASSGSPRPAPGDPVRTQRAPLPELPPPAGGLGQAGPIEGRRGAPKPGRKGGAGGTGRGRGQRAVDHQELDLQAAFKLREPDCQQQIPSKRQRSAEPGRRAEGPRPQPAGHAARRLGRRLRGGDRGSPLDRPGPGRADRSEPGFVRTLRFHGPAPARLWGGSGHGQTPRGTRDVFPDPASFQGGRPEPTHVHSGERQASGTSSCALTRPV